MKPIINMSTKILPSSQISLISSVTKCKCWCIRPPCWNIPPITNLYPVADPSKPIPLSKLKLEGSIQNSSASMSFVQTFKNDSENPVECIYKFPSDYTFAVVGLSVTVGDKTIETEIMEKKQAEQKYDDAIAAGHTAVKLNYDEKLPDIIELNIGQLQPGDTAQITVRMVAELEVIKHGFFSFVFPLDFFPRYGAEQGLLGETGKLLPAEFEADITLKSSSIITNLDVSHKGFAFEQSEDGCEVHLNLAPSKDIAAKDIVISYSTEHIREPQLVLTRCDKYPGEVAAHISYIPRSSEEHEVDEGIFSSFINFKNTINILDEESKESEKKIWLKSMTMTTLMSLTESSYSYSTGQGRWAELGSKLRRTHSSCLSEASLRTRSSTLSVLVQDMSQCIQIALNTIMKTCSML